MTNEARKEPMWLAIPFMSRFHYLFIHLLIYLWKKYVANSLGNI
jgi:hypothetical protein